MGLTSRTPEQLATLRLHVRDIVNAADPLNVLHHAPNDEYSAEVDDILAAYLKTGTEVETLTEAIQHIFERWFGPASVSPEKARFVAIRMCEVLPMVDGSQSP